jgi:hypothetical protein
VQVAVDTEYHLIMMHELTKVGSDHTTAGILAECDHYVTNKTLRLASARKI